MTLLFVHVARRFVLTFAAVLGILCALVTTLKLIESSRSIMQHEAPMALLGLLALCIALEFCHRLFFVALLLAAVMCTNRMARKGELLGLWAQGLDPKVLARPFMIAALVLTAGILVSGDRLLPSILARRTALLQVHLGKVEPATLYFQKRSPWYFEGDSIYHLPELLPEGTGFGHPSVYLLCNNQLKMLLKGESLTYDGPSGWRLNNAVCYHLTEPQTSHHLVWPLPLRIAPAALMAHMGNPRELSHRRAQALIARRTSSGLDTTVHRLEVLERLLQPLSAPLLLAAALPWLLRQDRRRPLAVSLCAGVALVACVMVMGQTFRLLSLGHHLPIALGASGQVVSALLCCVLWLLRQIIFSGRTKASNVAAST